MSFNELELASRKFATYLQNLGLAKGTRVAVMMPNVLQYPVVALAVLRAGLVLVNVNPLYTARELEHQLNDSGAEVLVIIENFASVYQSILGKTPVKHVVVASVGDMLGTLKGTLVNFVLRKVRKQIPAWNIPGHVKFNSALNKENPSNYKRPTLTLSDTAVLQYTGGTTGVSKGAELTHRNLVANLYSVMVFSKANSVQTMVLKAIVLFVHYRFTIFLRSWFVRCTVCTKDRQIS